MESPDTSSLLKTCPSVKRWFRLLLSFFVGQSAVQAISFLTGFLLVRWMSVEAYAQYSIVFGFQCTLTIFVDLGIGGCIVSLVGNRGDQPDVIGGYIAAAKSLRTLLLTLVTPVAAVAFFLLGNKHRWSVEMQLLLFLCVVLTICFESRVAWFGAPLLIHQRIPQSFRVNGLANLGRLCTCTILHFFGVLGSLSLAVINMMSTAWIGMLYAREARPYIQMPRESAESLRREMFRYIAPTVPAVAFNALQGQILIFMISVFGHSHDIAEVAALGRLGQLFALLSAANGALFVPYFAQLSESWLARRYLQLITVVVLVAAAIPVFAFLWPGSLLWLLGSHYSHLRHELGWMLVGQCLLFLASVMWTIHASRRWVFWWATALYIFAVTATQSLFIAFHELKTTMDVAWLGAITGAVVVGVQIVTAVAGFRGCSNVSMEPQPQDETVNSPA